MDAKLTRKMLKLASNPNATVDQLMAGIAMMDAAVAADNARRAAMPPAPVLTKEEQEREQRRRINANLVALRKKSGR